jgi:hypothetical protein
MPETKPALTAVKSIKAYCLGCCLESAREVALCSSTDCPLYPYRQGKNPRKKRVLTEEQKEVARKRFAKALNRDLCSDDEDEDD